MALEEEKCVPCQIGSMPISQDDARVLAVEVPLWTLQKDALQRLFTFDDFREAINFVDRVADVAEEEGHHPDIVINYNKVTLTLTTHKAGGLTRNDFILAAKIDKVV